MRSLSRRLHNLLLLVAASLLLAGVGAVVAQQPAPRPPVRPPPRPGQPAQPAQPTQPTRSAPAPASGEPQQTSATYDDWVLQCQTRTGPPVEKLCEMQQIAQAQVQGQSRP